MVVSWKNLTISFCLIFLVLFSFLIDFSKQQRQLTTNPNTFFNSSEKKQNIPWQADLVNCDQKNGVQTSEKITTKKSTLEKLFFKHRQKVDDVFSWIISYDQYLKQYPMRMQLTVSYFCQNNKSTSFPVDWRTNDQLKAKKFFLNEKEIWISDWLRFLDLFAKSQTWVTQVAVDDFHRYTNGLEFLKKIFFPAYLYFIKISRMKPYSDVSFLTFLENIKLYVTAQYAKKLINLQQARWLGVVPGISLQKLGPDQKDLTLLLNLDANILNLDDLSFAQKHVLLPRSLNYRLNKTPQNTWESRFIHQQQLEQIRLIFEEENFWSNLWEVLNNLWGIKFIFVNNKKYSFENLFTFANLLDTSAKGWTNFQKLNTQSRIELIELILAIKTNLQSVDISVSDQLYRLFENTEIKLFTELVSALEQLYAVDSATTRLPMKGQKYDLNQLLAIRKELLTMQGEAFALISKLFFDEIYPADINKSTKQLIKYKEISSFLIELSKNNQFRTIRINGQDYHLASLIADLKKQFINFSDQSFNELQTLVENNISLSQIENAYQKTLSSMKNKQQKVKSLTALAISLGTMGGIIFVAGTGFGLSYYLVKIRKPN